LFLFLVSSVLGLAIALMYKKTHRGFSYSQSFSITILLITVITTFIIFLIQDNVAAAIGIFGAFSIIRFRTAVKDVRDIAFIFFALASGLGVGIGAVASSLVGTAFVCALIFVLHKSNFGGLRKHEYVLNFKLDAKEHSSDVFKEAMTEFVKHQTLLHVEAKEKGAVLAFTFNITFKDENYLDRFVNVMNSVEGVREVNIVSSKNDLEF
jgi:uncharacterized membrane protein YhiD involved in acid resistance